MTEPGVTVQRRFAAPRSLVWALLSDTNRSDRALGMAQASYTWREIEGERRMVGRATQGGVRMEWIERPYQWVEGRYMEGRRDYLAGPALDGGLRIVVEDDGDGCIARVTASGRLRGLLLRTLGPVLRSRLRRRLLAYMDAVAQLAESADGAATSLPAAAEARRLLSVSGSSLVVGGHSTVDTAQLQRRRARLLEMPVDKRVAAALADHLAVRPDEDVAQMRPFELASAWQLDRRAVLRGFLHATKAGLVDLDWQINCPVCKVSAGVVRSLADVETSVHCDACNVRYDVDFGANVEAVFRCNAAVRVVETSLYCAASPTFRPHVLAQLRLVAGETRVEPMDLADGHLYVRTLGKHVGATLEQDVVPARIEIVVGPQRVEATAHGEAGQGPTQLHLRTDEDEAVVSIERAGWSADAVLGSVVASLPDFVDLFATEAPAAGLELSIGQLTLLFSDLTGSTALYERVGDARAFAIVQEHFRVMEAAIERHEGALVKTMGDAVMATFSSLGIAVDAALEMAAETQRVHGELGIGVKLGVHEGACLAVRANDRLDFFGTAVNTAARLQGQAGEGKLVMLGSAASEPSIAARLRDRPQRSFAANLKGLEHERQLVEIDLRDPPPGEHERVVGRSRA
jgi:class 3 adenylate cyclase